MGSSPVFNEITISVSLCEDFVLVDFQVYDDKLKVNLDNITDLNPKPAKSQNNENLIFHTFGKL